MEDRSANWDFKRRGRPNLWNLQPILSEQQSLDAACFFGSLSDRPDHLDTPPAAWG